MTFYIILGILIFILLIFILEIVFLNRIKMCIARIDEAECNIDILLQKKYKLLEKGISSIGKIKKYKEDQIIKEFNELDIKKYNNYSLNDILNKFEAEFRGYIDLDKKISEDDDVLDASFDLLDTNNELNASKKYYNRNTVKYNKLVKNFPSNIVAVIKNLKVKDFYSEEKVESLEILKKK